MNFSFHYERLIARARGRVLEGYRERHHVLPRCMGGGNEPDNLVDLTPEEHYVAHQLLVKIHPSIPALVVATFRMAKKCTGNKAYGWLRRRHAIYMHDRMLGNKHLLGKTFSDESRAKVSASLIGNTRSAGRCLSVEHKERLRSWSLGRIHSVEARNKMSAANLGRPLSLAHRLKISKLKRGNKYSLGRKLSEETKQKIANAQRGTKRSVEHIEKMRAGHRAYYAAQTPEALKAAIPAALTAAR